MATVFALAVNDLRTFADKVRLHRSGLRADPTLQNSHLNGSAMSGSAAVKLVHDAGLEAMGERERQLDDGLAAIAWLADECANQFTQLQRTNADGIAQALRDMPTAAQSAEDRRRFGPDELPLPIPPLSPLDGGGVAVNGREISRPLAWSWGPLHWAPLDWVPRFLHLDWMVLESQPFWQQFAWILADKDDVDAIDKAAAYWQHVHGIMSSSSEWLDTQIGVAAEAFDFAETKTSVVLQEYLSNWAESTDMLASRIEPNSARFLDIKSAIETAFGDMVQIVRDVYPQLTHQQFQSMLNTIREFPGVEPIFRTPAAQEALELVRMAENEVARMAGLRVMMPLNKRLAEQARAIHASYAEGQSSWWATAPQADPTAS